MRSAPARHAQHLDLASPLRPLDLHQRHFEVLQPEIDREIIPPVLVHPSGPPPFSEEEELRMNQDVWSRQVLRISSAPLCSRNSESSQKARRALIDDDSKNARREAHRACRSAAWPHPTPCILWAALNHGPSGFDSLDLGFCATHFDRDLHS